MTVTYGMVNVTASTRAWYWTPEGELRECVVVEITAFGTVVRAVVDAVTLDAVTVSPEDVLIERPE